MGRGGNNIVCQACGVTVVRIKSLVAGTVQRCECGHVFDGRPPPKARKASPAPRGTAGLAPIGSGGASSWRQRRRRTGSRQPSEASEQLGVSSDDADSGVIRPLDKPAKTRVIKPEVATTIPAHPRAIAGAETKRLEESLSLLSPIDDAEIVASLTAKIAAAKTRVLQAKPLSQQIEGLVSYIQRKQSKVASLRSTIVNAHSDMVAIVEDVKVKEGQLAALRVSLAAEAEPGLVAQASLATSQQHQLTTLQSTVQVLCNALAQSSIPIPEEVRASLTPIVQAGPTFAPGCFQSVDFANASSFGAALPSLGVRAQAQPYPDSSSLLHGFNNGFDNQAFRVPDAVMDGADLPVGGGAAPRW